MALLFSSLTAQNESIVIGQYNPLWLNLPKPKRRDQRKPPSSASFPHYVGLTTTASPLYLLRLSMASTISPEEEEEDRVCINTVRKAVRALLRWRKLHPRAAQKPASQLLDEQHQYLDEETDDGNEDFIYLLVTLKKIPPKDLSKTPHKIPLPPSPYPPPPSSQSLPHH